jgi:hypothetical protein
VPLKSGLGFGWARAADRDIVSNTSRNTKQEKKRAFIL